MKRYRLTFTMDIYAQDDPSARTKALGPAALINSVLYKIPFGYKLQELKDRKPPRHVRFNLPEKINDQG